MLVYKGSVSTFDFELCGCTVDFLITIDRLLYATQAGRSDGYHIEAWLTGGIVDINRSD